MTEADRREYTLRWAKALWQSQIQAGFCSTPRPITSEMTETMLRAAAAAVAVCSDLPTWE